MVLWLGSTARGTRVYGLRGDFMVLRRLLRVGCASAAALAFAAALCAPALGAGDLVVTTGKWPTGHVGEVYGPYTFTAAAGVPPYKWSISAGSLPAGVVLDSNTGVLVGIPTLKGIFTFTVHVKDSLGNTATKDLWIAIDPGAPKIIIYPLPDLTSPWRWRVWHEYSYYLNAEGGVPPYTWSIIEGSLPPGLTLDPVWGHISGTPTTPGTYHFTLMVADNQLDPCCDIQEVKKMLIFDDPVIVNDSFPPGQIGLFYRQMPKGEGGICQGFTLAGDRVYTWILAEGGLPPGLSLTTVLVEASGGGLIPVFEIRGFPTSAGLYEFTLTMQDTAPPPPVHFNSKSFSIFVPPDLELLTMNLSEGLSSSQYLTQCEARGGEPPYTWSVSTGSLPGGLSLDPAEGVISGKPTTAGQFYFTVHVSDTQEPPDNAARVLVLTITDDEPPAVTSIATVPTHARERYDETLLLTATADDSLTGSSNIAAAEFFLDSDPGQGNAAPMQACDGAFDSPLEAVKALVPCAGWITPEAHDVYVRAKDSKGLWSAASKLTVDTVNDVPPGRILDLKAVPSDALVNAALAISGVSGTLPGTTPSNLSDGNLKTFWQSAGTATCEDEWVVADLGEVKTIAAVTLVPGPVAALFPRDFRLDVSPDGSAWAAVARARSFAASAAKRYVWQFDPLEARYVRVSGKGVWNPKAANYSWQMAEIEGPLSLSTSYLNLTWTAPADNFYAGDRAALYDVRCSKRAIGDASFLLSTKIEGVGAPGDPGTLEHITVDLGCIVGRLCVAVKTADIAGNWSDLSNLASARVGGARILSTLPTDGTLADPASAPTFSYESGLLAKSLSVVVSTSPGFPVRPAARDNGWMDATIRFGVPATSTTWKVSASNWARIKRIVLPDGVLYWRVEGRGAMNKVPAVLYGPTRSFYFDVGAIENLAISNSHDRDGCQALWPVVSVPPAFSWDDNTVGMAKFFLDVSSDPKVPLRDRLHSVILGGKAGITANAYTANAAEWKKIRQIAALGDGTLYWRVRALDKDGALSCGSCVRKFIVDGGEWSLSALDLSETSPAVSWTHSGDGIAVYALQFSSKADFPASSALTVKIPAAPTAALTYALTPLDVARLKALAHRVSATDLYYRVLGYDAEKAFIAKSPAQTAPVP